MDSRGSMILKTFPMDMEFYKTIYELTENMFVNTSASREHVDEIERTIRTVKERN